MESSGLEVLLELAVTEKARLEEILKGDASNGLYVKLDHALKQLEASMEVVHSISRKNENAESCI